MFEDELVPLFETEGKLYDFRLMMEPMTGNNRGYGFATYMDNESAKQAAKKVFYSSQFLSSVSLACRKLSNSRLFI